MKDSFTYMKNDWGKFNVLGLFCHDGDNMFLYDGNQTLEYWDNDYYTDIMKLKYKLSKKKKYIVIGK